MTRCTATNPARSNRSGSSVWEDEDLHRASDDPDDPRPRFYALDMFPYPSGDLHLGSLRRRSAAATPSLGSGAMQGYNVLHPIGWDSFGLPAENAAIKRGIHPKRWTYENIEQQARSFKRMGMSFDWTRRLQTSDPEYYRWTQWLFLKLFEMGLAYRKNAPANWCPNDQTVLANEQVINGFCERCGTAVVRKDLTQWFFKITDYAQRLIDDMDTLEEWPERVHHDAEELDRPHPRARRSDSRSSRRATRSRSSRRARTRSGASRSSCSLRSTRWSRSWRRLGGTSDAARELVERSAGHAAHEPRAGGEPRGRPPRRPRREPRER